MAQKRLKGSAPVKPSSAKIRTNAIVPPPGWLSNNWSGYAIKSTKRNTFHSIAGFWIVPRVRASKKNTYSSTWIGIDGFNNDALIQTGTEQDFINGKPVYYPWWEILPAPETKINRPVSPFDLMYANITKLSKTKWLILLVNITKGWVFKSIKTYTGPATSAEWIMEAPTVNGKTATLANYGITLFDLCRVNNRNPLLKAIHRGVMIQNDHVVSTPSLPNKRRDGFTVKYGSTTPLPINTILKKQLRKTK